MSDSCRALTRGRIRAAAGTAGSLLFASPMAPAGGGGAYGGGADGGGGSAGGGGDDDDNNNDATPRRVTRASAVHPGEPEGHKEYLLRRLQ
jgi:hypothetical protein